MRLEGKSKKLLAITKSKAKMYEFGIAEEHHIDLPQNPQKLLLLTIGILGELAALGSRTENLTTELQDHFNDLKHQLVSVSQYFDALNHSLVEPELSNYLKFVGSAAYYLADMPGSSLVLAKGLKYTPVDSSIFQDHAKRSVIIIDDKLLCSSFSKEERLTPSYIEGVLVWLLKSDINSPIYLNTPFLLPFCRFFKSYTNFYKRKISMAKLEGKLEIIRQYVYERGNDRELLFVDILISVAKKKAHNSSLNCLPKYTGLAIEKWETTIQKSNFIIEFWPAQKLLGERGVLAGKSAVVQMPTSAGKTKSTELIIRSAFLSGRANLAVVIAPFRALCREISDTFRNVFEGEDIKLNELQDIPLLNDDENEFIKLLLGDNEQKLSKINSIVISTPEKFVYLLRHEPELASKIGLLIFDEGHQFDNGVRGVTYELLLASLKSSVSVDSQIVLISAVMANAHSIGEWLYGENGIDIQGSHCLPTIRSVAFTSWTSKLGKLQYIDQEQVTDRDFFVPRVIEQINLGTRNKERNDRLFPEKNKPISIAAFLGIKLCHQGPTAIFCGAKATVISISELLVDYYSRGLTIAAPLTNSDQVEISKIATLAKLHFNECHLLSKSIELGILPHSANIPNGLRVSVEWAMENNKACLVVCTSTLAQGVNLPIRYLIVSSTYQAGQEISTRDFQNLIGRAGRSGYHTEGSIIFANTDIYDKKNIWNEKWKWTQAIKLLDSRNAEDCLSSLKTLIEPFDNVGSSGSILNFISNPKDSRHIFIKGAEDRNLDIADLILKMNKKEKIIQAIESYILSYLKDNPELENEHFFIELAEDTLAFFLSSEDDRKLLVSAFELISKRVFSIDKNKISYYGKALLGIDQLEFIEDWLDKNYLELVLAETSENLLISFWPLLEMLSDHSLMAKIRPPEVLIDFSYAWIMGVNYHNLLILLNNKAAYFQANTQKRAITMDNIVELADVAIGYGAMLITGAIADIIEGKSLNKELADSIRLLQSRLKVGLSSQLEIWLFSKGFVDREVCKLISDKFIAIGVDPNKFSYKILDEYNDQLAEVLSTMPTYFSDIRLH
jgi:superfamily II DNA/RNA helicase